MLTRQDLHKISRTRLKEAKLLFDNDFFDGAKYIFGYCLETGLKARICRILDIPYPERGELTKVFFTHKFDTLVVLGGLEKQLDKKKYDDPTFGTNWFLLTDPGSSFAWSEKLRYEKIESASKPELEILFDALENQNHGVLTWLKKRW